MSCHDFEIVSHCSVSSLSLFYAGGNVCLVKEIVLFNRYFVATEIRVSVLLWDHFAYYTKTILYPYLYYYITIILYIYPIKCQGVQWNVFTQIDLCIRMQKNPIQRLLSHHFKKRFFGAGHKGYTRKLETRFCVLQLVQFFQQIFSLEWGIPMDLSCVRYWPVCCALQLFHFGSVSLRSLSRKWQEE